MTLNNGAHVGPYVIVTAVGAGGIGEVYKAKATRLDRTVAIKVLRDEWAADPAVQERFEREARAISKLNHPHIATLHDIGTHENMRYLVMEFVDGESLENRLSRGPMPVEQVLDVAMQIAGALDKAHREGIVHRDLKPGNIMLTRTGAKLLDFGLAKLKDASPYVTTASRLPTQAGSNSLTSEGSIVGTLRYMAPEQLEGKDADARTDIFALGATLYEMLTGRKAFTGRSPAKHRRMAERRNTRRHIGNQRR